MSRLMRLLYGDRRDPRDALREIFGVPATSGSPQAAAIDWARGVLALRAVDPARTPIDAIRVLRQEEPRLDLRPARYLVEHLGRAA